ncbi:hypothetical protein GALL_451610 [mine drainage metagenome]|uniref:Uncharacterized protein n=1 Tax=mine drainage metagenome TaxID=410659 RepID=A0A1J5PPY8_9ZZZZ
MSTKPSAMRAYSTPDISPAITVSIKNPMDYPSTVAEPR